MDEIRRLLQIALQGMEGLDVGVTVPDDVVEDGKTYFGYTLSEDYIDSDFDRNYSMQISLIGFLVRKNNSEEDTLQTMDNALDYIKYALKSLNFTYNYEDVTIDNNVRKIRVTGTVRYNEINKWLI